MKYIFIVFIAFITLIIIFRTDSRKNEPRTNVNIEIPTKTINSAGKIGKNALLPYTESTHPNAIKIYATRLQEIETFRRHAAEMAAKSGKCDVVTQSELSATKSSIDQLSFFVTCNNEQRIYLDELQIMNMDEVMTQEELSWAEPEARSFCSEAIKQQAIIPSAVDIHAITGTAFNKSPVTHAATLNMDFDAKNLFGIEAPYTATCHFEPGADGTITVVKR